MNTLIISASPRKNSNSLRFSKYLAQTITNTQGNDINIVSFENADIPFFGRGQVDKNNLTPFQSELTSAWAAADAVFIVMPEYNWMPTGEFINALSVLGSNDFAHLFDSKTFALVGVSAGRGGRMPCMDLMVILNKLINFLDQYSIVSPRIFEAHEVPKNLDENSVSVGNPIFEKGVADFVHYSLAVAERWSLK